jgi:RNA polymerase sigma factor (sigma-70 family)
MRRTRDPELAADLAAETFAVALVAARKYRGDGAPASAWLIGIARNTLFASLRRSRVEDRARRRLGMEPIQLDEELLARIEWIGGDSRVETLLGQLTPEQSDAVRARVLGEAEYAEIALRLRCSESVVRQRVHRGLTVLRRIYEEEAS